MILLVVYFCWQRCLFGCLLCDHCQDGRMPSTRLWHSRGQTCYSPSSRFWFDASTHQACSKVLTSCAWSSEVLFFPGHVLAVIQPPCFSLPVVCSPGLPPDHPRSSRGSLLPPTGSGSRSALLPAGRCERVPLLNQGLRNQAAVVGNNQPASFLTFHLSPLFR